MRSIVAAIFCLFFSGIAEAATISGTVSSKTGDDLIALSMQLHKKDLASGYLVYVATLNAATCITPCYFSFTLPEPIDFADAVFEEYLLEAKAENHLLARVSVSFDSVNDVMVNVTLTPSVVVFQLTPGQMAWDENLATLSWPIPLKNQTAEKQRVLVHAVYNGPVATDFWGQLPAFSGVVPLDPSCWKEEVFSMFVPADAVPEGYSVCLWVFVTKVEDPFTVYDSFYDCALKSHAQPTSPPTPKG